MIVKKPMLAATPAVRHPIRFPCLGSGKIDGFRLLLPKDDAPLTRKLKPFPNLFLNEYLSTVAYGGDLRRWTHPTDGEVTVGKTLQDTSSGVTSIHGKPDFTYWVFDIQHPTLPFVKRLAEARQIVRAIGSKRVKYWPHKLLNSMSELWDFHEENLAEGLEGTMTRTLDGLYKFGRATPVTQDLVKHKDFVSKEGIVIGYFEEEENLNPAIKDATGKSKRSSHKENMRPKGRLGGVILKGDIRVGGGFTEEQRIELWKVRQTLPGRICIYKKQLVGELNKPRHTSFLAWGHEIDR